MARWLFIAGAAPFVVLGLLHLLYTLLDIVSEPRWFSPRDRELIARMDATGIGLTKQTTMWRAWLGFNISHSLGALLFGVVGLYVAGPHFDRFAADMPEVLFAMPVVALAYWLTSIRYWFRIPSIGTGISTVLMTTGAVMMVVAGAG